MGQRLGKEKLYEYATSSNYEKALVDNYLKISKERKVIRYGRRQKRRNGN